jgi:hypothetical protein
MYWRYRLSLITATSLYEPSGIQIIDHRVNHHLVRVATSLICDHTGVVSKGLKRNMNKQTLTVMATCAHRKTQESKKNSLFRMYLQQTEYGSQISYIWMSLAVRRRIDYLNTCSVNKITVSTC